MNKRKRSTGTLTTPLQPLHPHRLKLLLRHIHRNNNSKETFPPTLFAAAILFGVIIGVALFVYRNKLNNKTN